MATVTDIKNAKAKGNSQLISYPEKMTDVSDASIHVMGVLQSTLELEKLIELFKKELNNNVPHEHFVFTNEQEQILIKFGKTARHSINYRLVLFGKELGELSISRKTKFKDNEIHDIENLISAIIYPLRNALLYKQALEKAYIDPLTGVSNRAAFDQAINQEFELAKRHNHGLSIMLLDIDHFKEVNDTHGHVVGDMVLKAFAETLTECMRRSDAIFRYGGEEFILLLRNTELKGATLLAERMRKKVAKKEFDFDSVQLNISTSIGVAQQRKKDNHTDLIERADALLYQAKANGRNKVVCET